MVAAGRARGVVVGTGTATAIGQIRGAMTQVWGGGLFCGKGGAFGGLGGLIQRRHRNRAGPQVGGGVVWGPCVGFGE